MGLRGLVTIFFFNDTATTEIYTLSLHDALPISLIDRTLTNTGSSAGALAEAEKLGAVGAALGESGACRSQAEADRKSTRLNSSHSQISYAVFCLKKKKKRLPGRRPEVGIHDAAN